MKRGNKKMIMIVVALIIIGGGLLFMFSKTYTHDHSDHKGHDHSDKESGKDGCMCKCEYTSNQNETSCNDHGGCKWTGSKCITE